jgi:hypothetical protein
MFRAFNLLVIVSFFFDFLSIYVYNINSICLIIDPLKDYLNVFCMIPDILIHFKVHRTILLSERFRNHPTKGNFENKSVLQI